MCCLARVILQRHVAHYDWRVEQVRSEGLELLIAFLAKGWIQKLQVKLPELLYLIPKATFSSHVPLHISIST